MLASQSNARAFGRRESGGALARIRLPVGWTSLGAVALLCSTVAWASLPPVASASTDEQIQWQALGVSPLASRGTTGMAMVPTEAAAPIAFAPVRSVTPEPVAHEQHRQAESQSQ